MKSPMDTRRHRKKLHSSNFGDFEATIKSTEDYLEYASVTIYCCNYKYHNKLIEAVQPILDELKVEMDNLLREEREVESDE